MSYYPDMKFGEKLTKLIQEQRLSIKEVSLHTDINYETIRGYMRTDLASIPNAYNGVALAKFFGVQTEWLFDDSQGWPPPKRMAKPPFEIYPWPPGFISWDRLALIITEYADSCILKSVEGIESDLDRCIKNKDNKTIQSYRLGVEYYLDELQSFKGVPRNNTLHDRALERTFRLYRKLEKLERIEMKDDD